MTQVPLFKLGLRIAYGPTRPFLPGAHPKLWMKTRDKLLGIYNSTKPLRSWSLEKDTWLTVFGQYPREAR